MSDYDLNKILIKYQNNNNNQDNLLNLLEDTKFERDKAVQNLNNYQNNYKTISDEY